MEDGPLVCSVSNHDGVLDGGIEELVDALAQFGGIRIEDDVVVQEKGIRNLTREALPQGGGLA